MLAGRASAAAQVIVAMSAASAATEVTAPDRSVPSAPFNSAPVLRTPAAESRTSPTCVTVRLPRRQGLGLIPPAFRVFGTSTAAAPARRPKAAASSKELLARRLAPWTPVRAHSPAAYRPSTDDLPSRSVTTPPIV